MSEALAASPARSAAPLLASNGSSDMVKAEDPGMEIEKVRLLEKTGGTHGDWRRDAAD